MYTRKAVTLEKVAVPYKRRLHTRKKISIKSGLIERQSATRQKIEVRKDK